MKQTIYHVETYDKEKGRFDSSIADSKSQAEKITLAYISQGYFVRFVEEEIDVVEKEFEDCFELLCNQMRCSDCPYANVRGAEDCLESAREDAKTDADKLLIISKMMKAIHY